MARGALDGNGPGFFEVKDPAQAQTKRSQRNPINRAYPGRRGLSRVKPMNQRDGVNDGEERVPRGDDEGPGHADVVDQTVLGKGVDGGMPGMEDRFGEKCLVVKTVHASEHENGDQRQGHPDGDLPNEEDGDSVPEGYEEKENARIKKFGKGDIAGEHLG